MQVTLSRIGEGIRTVASRIGEELGIAAFRVGGDLAVSVTQLHAMTASATRIGHGLEVSCGLVCTVNETKRFLEVQPEIIFLTPANGWSADVQIISNVEWIIGPP